MLKNFMIGFRPQNSDYKVQILCDSFLDPRSLSPVIIINYHFQQASTYTVALAYTLCRPPVVISDLVSVQIACDSVVYSISS